ncbi:site-specific DNA-methyltransferase [Ensifer sp. ENS10]|uniref:DNA-methyltransferase n=1 Tax=unclassified Ensifer TaxID=2633371 RepID=UPI00177CBA8E|nr:MULTISPECIES: site-specific DNA-methyltransferase [unclassified Ensifer]MBD9510022.1 site-specific DNA-methyltransferase [Ensifer sp. ENS10]MBV7522383.1 site-specific DNA-methyltransferase [Ensifer sp. ENS12]
MSFETRSILHGRCTIHVGDCLDVMRAMPSGSVDCVVTSPPYWGLRDYGVEGQIGLEPTLGQHLAVMVEVFAEVWRILKPQGTLWLNYGDCYAAAPNGKSAEAYKAEGSDDRTFRDKPFSTVGPIYQADRHGDRGVRGKFHRRAAGVSSPGAIVAGGYLKPKDLCMIPNRLAIALQEAGWWVRSEIIWHKPNPMPESVYDRPTTAHEKVFLLTKGEEYFYEHEAIREPVTGGSHARKPGPNSRQNVDRVPVSRKLKVPGGWDVEPGAHGTINRSGRTSSTYKIADEGDPYRKSKQSFRDSTSDLTETRNARNVWTIAPKAFREAHFATFPPALAERCIKAGTPKTVCGCCGVDHGCGPICETFDRVPGTVFDPFGGAGTVGLVAEQLGLRSILIELNPEYADIAVRRIEGAERKDAA